jgi:hypothetical protein
MRRQPFKSKRHRRPAADQRAMDAYRKAHPVCEACRNEPTADCHHIVSEKSGGPSEDWNFLALGFNDHVYGFHLWGWKGFCDRYPHLAGKITAARIRCGRKTT